MVVSDGPGCALAVDVALITLVIVETVVYVVKLVVSPVVTVSVTG